MKKTKREEVKIVPVIPIAVSSSKEPEFQVHYYTENGEKIPSQYVGKSIRFSSSFPQKIE